MKPATAFPSDELMALFLFGSMMNHIGVWRRSDGRLTWMIRYPDPCFALPVCSDFEKSHMTGAGMLTATVTTR